MITFNESIPPLAFAIALAAVILSPAVNTIYGKSPSTNQCIAAEETIQEGCTTSNPGPQCTVILVSTNEIAPAYKSPFGICTTPLKLPY